MLVVQNLNWMLICKCDFLDGTMLMIKIKKESKKHTKCNKNTDQTLNAAKKIDEDRKRVAVSSCKKDLSLSACVNHLKSMDKNRTKRQSNQQVPKPRKINKLNESFM